MDASSRTSGSDVVWLVPLAVVVVLGSFFTNVADDHSAHTTFQPWMAAAVAAIAVAGLFGSLRWPLAGALTTYGAVTVFVVLDVRNGPVYLTLAAAAFLVAARVPAREWVRAVVAGAVAVCAALLVRTVTDFDNERSLWQLAAVAGVVPAGAAIRTLIRVRRLAAVERVQAAATREQLQMAQDLHDGVGHGLAVIAMQAGVGLHVLDSDPTAARNSLEVIRASAREALEALRSELAQLAGEAAPRRPQHGTADLVALVERVRAAGLSVTMTGSAGHLAESVDAAVYSIVQEGLTNVLRHSGATSVDVRLDRSRDRLGVTVMDDGQGTLRHVGAVEGMRLRDMRQRVQALGGEVSAGPGPGSGFVVRAVLPL